MLTVHRAERADRLVEALAAVLAEPVEDPFAPEVVAVPSRGIERWLTQQLSNVLGATLGAGRRHLRQRRVPVPRPPRRHGTAVGDRHRPRGRPVAAGPGRVAADAGHRRAPRRGVDGARSAPHLGAPDDETTAGPAVRHGSPPRRPVRPLRRAPAGDDHPLGGRATTSTGSAVALPARPGLAGDAVAAAARAHRRCPARPSGSVRRASRLRAEPRPRPAGPGVAVRAHPAGAERAGRARRRRRAPATSTCSCCTRHRRCGIGSRRQPGIDGHRPSTRCCATWGKDAREMQLAISATLTGGHAEMHHPGEIRGRHACCAGCRPTSAPTSARPGRRSPAAGRSSASSSSRRRQRAGPLVPRAGPPGRGAARCDPPPPRRRPDARAARRHRDVPGHRDVRPAHPRHVRRGDDVVDAGATRAAMPELPVRLADRAVRQTNPVLAALAELLELAVGARHGVRARRLRRPRTRPATVPPRRRRPRPRSRSGSARPASAGASTPPTGRRSSWTRVGANTWRAGLDRVLLGCQHDRGRPAARRRRAAAGRRRQRRHRAGRTPRRARRSRPRRRRRPDAAASRCSRGRPRSPTAVDALTACTPRDAWQRAELDQLLEEVVEESRRRRPCCRCPSCRSLLGDRLQGRPSRANFRTGHLTICTLVPMRSVPHRVVCLLGLDDGVVPPPRRRPTATTSSSGPPQVGDHDVRSEDRQLLLDALLAAGDHLVVTYSGRDERTNAVPSAVRADRRAPRRHRRHGSRPIEGSAREHVLVEHPLQPFDARNFEPALVSDAVELRRDRARRRRRARPRRASRDRRS